MKGKVYVLIMVIGMLQGCRDAHNTRTSDTKPPGIPTRHVFLQAHGFVLPPEPDPKVNASTLAGIDTNGNGIRDDVERKVIVGESNNTAYAQALTAIALQYARAWQQVVANPRYASKKYLDDALGCLRYFYNRHTKNLQDIHAKNNWEKSHMSRTIGHLEDWVFNTKIRMVHRFDYHKQVRRYMPVLKTPVKERCLYDLDAFGE